MAAPPILHALLDALDEPTLLIEGERTVYANAAARALLGDVAEQNIRLAIRQPAALAAILSGKAAEVEIGGIGGMDRNWGLSVRPLGKGLKLVRLVDRSSLRAAERMRVDFVANASHELRTPLATVVGYAETLAEDGELPDELRTRFGKSIHGEARRMLRIVEDLMSLSRIEAERFVEPAEQVDMGEIVRIAAENGQPLAEARGCSIRVEIGEGLPRVVGDFGQLLQVMDNLIANAIRYGCSQRSPEITVRARDERGFIVVGVEDKGEGIHASHIPRLTERFYRVDAARSRDSGGTGLGLAIVKHIVERHRGMMEIRSRVGMGTEVLVRLPLS